MTKSEITNQLIAAHEQFYNCAINCVYPYFVQNQKWSIAQNVAHINIALQRLSNFLRQPKVTIKSQFGMVQRLPSNPETIIKFYKDALANQASATPAYTPEEDLKTDLKTLIHLGKTNLEILHTTINEWSEQELDQYNCPHPLLGNISIREVLYFTIYHVQHHHQTIIKLNQDAANET